MCVCHILSKGFMRDPPGPQTPADCSEHCDAVMQTNARQNDIEKYPVEFLTATQQCVVMHLVMYEQRKHNPANYFMLTVCCSKQQENLGDKMTFGQRGERECFTKCFANAADGRRQNKKAIQCST